MLAWCSPYIYAYNDEGLYSGPTCAGARVRVRVLHISISSRKAHASVRMAQVGGFLMGLKVLIGIVMQRKKHTM